MPRLWPAGAVRDAELAADDMREAVRDVVPGGKGANGNFGVKE